MTSGHRHRIVHVRRHSLVRRLTSVTVWRTRSITRADRSWFVYAPDAPDGWFRLSLLGFLHPITGLTLWMHGSERR